MSWYILIAYDEYTYMSKSTVLEKGRSKINYFQLKINQNVDIITGGIHCISSATNTFKNSIKTQNEHFLWYMTTIAHFSDPYAS